MSTYQRREISSTRVEFAVPASAPWGACWVEVMKAISAATAELQKVGRVAPGVDPADDVIRIVPGDDMVIVFYESETVLR